MPFEVPLAMPEGIRMAEKFHICKWLLFAISCFATIQERDKTNTFLEQLLMVESVFHIEGSVDSTS